MVALKTFIDLPSPSALPPPPISFLLLADPREWADPRVI